MLERCNSFQDLRPLCSGLAIAGSRPISHQANTSSKRWNELVKAGGSTVFQPCYCLPLAFIVFHRARLETCNQISKRLEDCWQSALFLTTEIVRSVPAAAGKRGFPSSSSLRSKPEACNTTKQRTSKRHPGLLQDWLLAEVSPPKLCQCYISARCRGMAKQMSVKQGNSSGDQMSLIP